MINRPAANLELELVNLSSNNAFSQQESISSPILPRKKALNYDNAIDTPLPLEVIPTTVCMLVNTILTLINVYHNKRSENQLIGMALGTIMSTTFGYLLVSSLNLGLACEIARAQEKKRQRIIGIFYQRALVVDFVACILIVTPVLYLSNKILTIGKLSDNRVIEAISKYLFQLVPSIYAFTFFDTTRVFLQAQYVRTPPMLILLVSIFFHYFVSSFLIDSKHMESMGAAWAKNFTDIICAIVIYIYVVKSEIVKSTWIEWNIQCLTNWLRHLKLFIIIGFTSYLEALMFLLFVVAGSTLSRQDLAAHISLANWTQVTFLVFIGIKQGLLSQMYELLAKNMWIEAKDRAFYGFKLTFGFSLLIDLLLLLYKREASTFFLNEDLQGSRMSFQRCFWIYLLTNVVDALQLVISAVLKAVDTKHPVLKTSFVCYLIGIISALYLAHHQQMSLKGLWIGWTFGLCLNLTFCLLYLKKLLRKWDLSTSLEKQKQQQK